MRIIIVGTAYPYRGGLSAYNERLAREYQRQGHEVEMITFTLQYPDFLFPGKTQYSDAPAPDDLAISRTIHAMNPLSWIRTGRLIKSRQPDRVVFCYWMAFMAPAFATIARFARTGSVRMVGLIHNMIPHEPSLLDKLLPGFFVSAMDGFVAMSSSVATDIRSYDRNNKPVRVSPHPVYDHYGSRTDRQMAAGHLGLNPAMRYVLFFGFIRHYKGLDLLLEAFADDRLRNYPVRLIVAGEFYEPRDHYLNIIQQHQLGEYVELRTDFIPDNEVQYYFSVAELVAQPYRTATQSGVSQIAYHFDVPMLVTNVGGLPEIVPHEKVGYVVDTEVKAIADALYDFFSRDRASGFIINIETEKKKFAWSRMTEAVDAV